MGNSPVVFAFPCCEKAIFDTGSEFVETAVNYFREAGLITKFVKQSMALDEKLFVSTKSQLVNFA